MGLGWFGFLGRVSGLPARTGQGDMEHEHELFLPRTNLKNHCGPFAMPMLTFKNSLAKRWHFQCHKCLPPVLACALGQLDKLS